jgi:hypothetical protein
MDGEACPSTDNMFTDITLGQYPKSSNSPSPANEAIRTALRMSLMLGHGSGKANRHRRNLALGSGAEEGQTEEDHGGMNAEAMLFPEGRQWDESMKPIPEHRVLLAALFENPPATEEEWEALEKDMGEEGVAQLRRSALC